MSQILYNIKQAFVQIGRNKAMSLASVFAITAMMLILGLFFVITVNINLFTEMVKSDYDQVEIFLLDETTTEEAQDIMDKIEGRKGVEKVEYRTKEDALNIMKSRWGESSYLLDSLGNNPLPNSVLITVDTLESAGAVTDYAASLDGVEDVKYYQETVEKLTKVTGFLQIAALIIMAFLVVVSIVVVSNTIKLTVFARSREISIMKYVGATNWFIRGPFLAEGIIIGILASMVSAGITFGIYSKIVDLIGTQVMTILSSPLVPAGYLAVNLICIFLAMGISIGAWGSIISMRRFLDT
ncbi:permease-like cell division protein FtsX [Anaerovoracaceae bacterium 41-7]|jgi:cell division transport system permease protein|uniref:Cell division protein FtsX n=1 Tax=Anaerotruncus colihominis TaxID=169435 RepID=A0A845QHP0_9FIRM|nr:MULTISPECIES: permease-like cell division protein FtsX [Clostridia]MCI9476053.1 ABC transporter permease [Emergencia sp.]MCI9639081.1 ABC transporter permease [Emergencia sp.]NBH60425.1 ABC transporter permease [Anaerotruncus colihominis]NCE99235.1 ABC transporter permease [Emergencia sp. 1XD21-10]NCF01079.1 ABC transporter permease [Anaerotruncus sp. 80]